MERFTILDLLDADTTKNHNLEITCLSGRKGLVREILLPEINRPGLALAGFYELFGEKRIQIFGRCEHSYLQKLENEDLASKQLKPFFEYDIPCCIFCHGLEPGDEFKTLAEKNSTPILQTPLETSDLSVRLIRLLSDKFAPKKTIHAVFVEVSGTGLLILGESGIGKSETALELIARGHQLISDDSVLIKRINGNVLMGHSSDQVLGSHMEIRGMGVINISKLFGAGAVKNKKQVEMVVKLEEWSSGGNYDRLGSSDTKTSILGVELPLITLPIKPGRNIPIIIEAAVLNVRLKEQGIDSARDFNKNVIEWLESENARSSYFENNR